MQDVYLQQLQEYITQCLAHGYTKEQIRHHLNQAGWPQEYVRLAFNEEQQTPVPPVPLHPGTLEAQLPKFMQSDFAQDIMLAFGLGLINLLAFLILLPSTTEQLVHNLISAYRGDIFPPIVFPIVITTLVIAGAVGLALVYGLKRKRLALGLLLVSLMAVFLAILMEGRRYVSTAFELSLLVTFPLSQLLWYYARRKLATRVVYGLAVVVLFIISTRMLNLGHL